MRKKAAGLPLYIVMAVLCTAVLFPVILAVILPFQAHTELKDTLSPLVNFTGKYARIDLLPQYPSAENFKELLVYSPEFYRVFWNSLLMVGGAYSFSRPLWQCLRRGRLQGLNSRAGGFFSMSM